MVREGVAEIIKHEPDLDVCGTATTANEGLEALPRLRPDLVIVDMDSPDRDTLEDMQRITSEQPRPIVMFVDESDSESIRTAVRAGVAAYVVKGSSADRIRPVLEVAVARFEEFQARVMRGERLTHHRRAPWQTTHLPERYSSARNGRASEQRRSGLSSSTL